MVELEAKQAKEENPKICLVFGMHYVYLKLFVQILLDRNRRASMSLSPILYLFQLPSSTLYRKLQIILSQDDQIPLVIETQRRRGPKDIPYGIPIEEWPAVLARVENHESYRKIARDYGVSRETIRRLVQALQKAG